MSGILASFLRKVRSRRAGPARVVHRWFRPTLESLEHRLVLDTFLWKGTTSVNWNDKTNWTVGGAAATRYPGDPGNNTDTAEFDSTATDNCELNTSVTLGTLQL